MKLSEKKLKELKSGKIRAEELNDNYFYTDKSGAEVDNILKLLNEKLCSFKLVVYKVRLYNLLQEKKLFEELLKANVLSQEDLKYLLNIIKESYDLRRLCNNTPLIKHILKEFVLDKETVDRLSAIIENDWYRYRQYGIRSLFDLIAILATHELENRLNNYILKPEDEIDNEVLKLNDLNRKTYLLAGFNLSLDQKLEIAEVLRDNEIAKNRLKDIVENHLESNYDFNSLMMYLSKKEKKSVLNI